MEAHARAYGPAPPPQASAPAGANNGVAQANGAANGSLPPAQPAVQEELSDVNPDGTPNWENRFRALKGRYDSDSRRYRETQEQYDLRMRDLSSENARLKSPPLPGEQPPPRLISQQEEADYGADFLDVVKRAAVEAVLPMMKPIAQEIGTVKARVENTESETGKQFVQLLARDGASTEKDRKRFVCHRAGQLDVGVSGRGRGGGVHQRDAFTQGVELRLAETKITTPQGVGAAEVNPSQLIVGCGGKHLLERCDAIDHRLSITGQAARIKAGRRLIVRQVSRRRRHGPEQQGKQAPGHLKQWTKRPAITNLVRPAGLPHAF
jgi:hypothetical protein